MSNSTPGALHAFPPPVDPDAPGRGPMILGVTWMLTVLCIVTVALRFYVRVKVLRSMYIEDWLMFIAVVLQLVSQGCITKSYDYGLGKRDMNLTYYQLMGILKWVWIQTTPGIIVSILARISIAVLLIRIFGIHTWLKWFLIIFTVIQSITASVLIIIVWVQVSPVEGLWNPLLPARRWDPIVQKTTALLGQSLFTFSDLTYVLFPVIIIWNLNLPLRRKIGLVLLMALSLFTMCASIMKTITSQSNSTDPNIQYNASMSLLWAIVEQTLVIIMGCIPSLRTLTRVDFPAFRSIGSSVISLFKTTPTSTQDTSTYHDLEMNTRKRDRHTPKSEESEAGYPSGELITTTHGTGAIQRADAYTVSYGDEANLRENV